MPQIQALISEMQSPTAMANQLASILPPDAPLGEDKKERLGLLISEAMSDIRPELEQILISSTAKAFSVSELQALIDFYSSEHGASAMAKMGPYMADVMTQMQPAIWEMQRDLEPKIVEIFKE